MSDLGPPTEPIPTGPAEPLPPPTTAPQPPVTPTASEPARSASVEPWGWLQVLALVALLLGLLLEEGGVTLWDQSEAWSVFAVACGAAQGAPLLQSTLKWPVERAWLVGVVGAAGLVLYWLLIVLPAIGRNTSFAVTVAAAAAAGAAWLAPGRHDPRR